ncbi:MAG TPA: DNA-processing protein DprA, partial [Terrimesophilobacter sp.]|nr:DNA-processing protein DprA [Terrimesophilobacter sp.]
AAPTKWRFLQRNRLIAAMSGATIVLEAGWRSGALNTAGHAAAIGRPLGAVPGPVTSAASAGCHRLIREYDAVCVTTAAEMAELAPPSVIEEFSSEASVSGTAPSVEADADGHAVRVLDALSARSPRTTDDIANRAGLTVGVVQAVLGRLELDGAATSRETGWVRAAARLSN